MERSKVILISSLSAVAILIIGGAGYFLLAGGDDTSLPTRDPSKPKPKPLVVKTYDPNAENQVANADADNESAAVEPVSNDPADTPWYTLADDELSYRVSFPVAPATFDPLEEIKGVPGKTAFTDVFRTAVAERATRDRLTFAIVAGLLVDKKPEQSDGAYVRSAGAPVDRTEELMARFTESLPSMHAPLKVGSLRDTMFGDRPGKEILLVGGTKKRLERVFAANGRLYALSVEGVGELSPDDPYITGFFDSLVLSEPVEAAEGNDETANSNWAETQGSVVGFSILFPAGDVQKLDILQTLTNPTTQTQLARKWQEQKIQYESRTLEVGNRIYSVTAFLDMNQRAPEFSRINMQKARMEPLLKGWYGSDTVNENKYKVTAPPPGNLVADDEQMVTGAGKVVIMRRVLAGMKSFFLRVEGPVGMSISDEDVVTFLTSLKVLETGGASTAAAATNYDQVVVKRFHPLSGLDVELEDGSLVSLKPTAATKLVDAEGKPYPETPSLDQVLQVGNIVNLVVNVQQQPNQQRIIRQIQAASPTDVAVTQ